MHSIAVVEARRLLPRWDLATHLVLGWFDYHWLAAGRIHRLLWDLWLQGYWPPALSIYQIPFYLALHGRMTAALWSSLTAFVLCGVVGSLVLWRQSRDGAVAGASVFLALLISSPYLLAYASVTMTEMLGALVQLVVVLCYVTFRQRPTPRSARAFVVSLTVLFFTKYNYFFLLAGPLLLHEWLERTSDQNVATRLTGVAQMGRRLFLSRVGLLLTLYLAALVVISRTGGFEAHVFGRRISVRTIGNTGHVVLYLLLGRIWYLHRRGRIDWRGLMSADLRIRPLLLWFALPVTVWLASPYPNHIRDFANLVFNRPLGEATVASGVSTYVEVLRTTYFYTEAILAAVIAAFSIAAWRYRRQPPWVQWLVVAIPLQFAAIAVHQTRFPRFLLLTVVLLCLVASSEAGAWCAASRRRRLAGALMAPVILLGGVAAAKAAVEQDRFRDVAFENYTDSPPLRAALDSIRSHLDVRERLAVVGEGNQLSPALLRWELGPPSGLECSPFSIGGAARLDLALATRVLLMEPLDGDESALDLTGYYLAQRRTFVDRVQRGEFTLTRDIALRDLHVALRLYDRTVPPLRLVPCD